MKACDLFGLPVTLTYKGRNKYTSAFGGILTIMTILFLGIYAAKAFRTGIQYPDFITLPSNYRRTDDLSFR